jgi:hypothetical protein
MEALISVGGYGFPEPSSYSAITSTIVDSARAANGYVVGSVIRYDVAKIELSWKYLTVRQWADILSCFSSSFFNDVRFFNQVTGNYDVRTMYVSDRDASMFRRDPQTGEVLGWLNPKLSLVER